MDSFVIWILHVIRPGLIYSFPLRNKVWRSPETRFLLIAWLILFLFSAVVKLILIGSQKKPRKNEKYF